MKRIRVIPTILAVLFLMAGIATGVVLIRQSSKWSLKATPGNIPKQVKITNISDSSFTVSWITDGQTSCFVKYGPDENLSFTAKEDRDQASGKIGSFYTHHISIRGLNPATTYFFEIDSNETPYDNNGEPYQTTTAPEIQTASPTNDVAYGMVVGQDGSSPIGGIIVYLSLANAAPQSTLTTSSGNWVIPLSLSRSADLNSWASYDRDTSVEEIFVQGGTLGTATAVAVTRYDNPMPIITLGQTFDFRKAPSGPTPTPTQSAGGNRFSFPGAPTSSPTSIQLNIINPQEGEEISTQKPQFMGTGPKKETLQIILESSAATYDEVSVDEKGNWNWTPPTNLSPGQHTITISLANGKKVVRTFMVLAAEGELPNFSASPSASLTPTLATTPTPLLSLSPTPTLTVTPTPSTIVGRISKPSTEGGVPRSGYLTPTFAFLIIGIILIGVGLCFL